MSRSEYDAKIRYWMLRLEQARRLRLAEDALGLPARLPAKSKVRQHRLVAGLVAAVLVVGTPVGVIVGTRAHNAPPLLLAPAVVATHRRRVIGYRLPPKRLNSCSIRASLASTPSFA